MEQSALIVCAHCAEQTPSEPACAACGQSPLLHERYRLLRQVGLGAQGVTWRAWDEAAGGAVAIKELPLRHADRDLRKRMDREARVLRELDHPGIPRYIDHFVGGAGRQRAFHIVQSFIDGCSLSAEMGTHRYTEGEVVALLVEVLAILEYLHGLAPPVIHRDLKPSNLIRRPDGRVALVDFGSVRDALADPRLGGSTMTGTYGYAAPEQFRGDADARTDLYAVGVLAVVLLSRRAPLDLIDTRHALAWQPHLRCSAPLQALLEALLQQDPARRPASAAAVRARLAAVGDAGPADAPAGALLVAGFGVGLVAIEPVPAPAAARVAVAAAPALDAADTGLFDRMQAAYAADDGAPADEAAAAWEAVADHPGASPQTAADRRGRAGPGRGVARRLRRRG